MASSGTLLAREPVAMDAFTSSGPSSGISTPTPTKADAPAPNPFSYDGA
jgi:hypothetical protein